MKHFVILPVASLIALSAAPLAMAAATTRLQNIQTKGNTDITNRTDSLGKLVTKVQGAKRLTTDQKNSLVSEMQGQVTSLNALKATLDGETTVTPALTDFSNIFKEHYIYAFYLPRTDHIVAGDAQSDAATNLTDLASKLDTLIANAGNQGNDVSNLETKLTELKTKAADAQTQSQTALTALLPLTAAGYPGNKATITTSSTTLKTGRADLETAQADAKAIVASLKTMLATPTATP